MPKQNRPLVRDGRLQQKKKRTDRSYLRSSPAAPAPVPGTPAASEEGALDPAEEASRDAVATAPAETAPVAAPREAPAPALRPSAPSRLPTSVRAIQQQGVRRRREFDVHELAVRDTQYAIHELRRIAILATMVIITLVVLGLLLR